MKNKLLICSVLFSEIVFGQLQNNTWYFSPANVGIQFNFVTNVPSVVTGHASLTSLHGCGIASVPSTGAVMFYTDGVNVFDVNNLQMPNAGSLNGGVSCAEKGNIVQVPGSCNRYYIFSDDANSPTAGSLYYSIVNMSLPGNGTVAAPTGDVEAASLNTVITNNSTESFTIAPNTNGNSFWLIVPMNNSATINVYSITTGGIAFANTFNTGTIYNSSMSIKYSALAGKVAYTSVVELDPALLMDFNATTGVLSNATIIPNTPVGTCTDIYHGWHDLEFSPDGTKLYMSKYRMFTPGSGGRIYQYDLSSPATPITPVFLNSTTNIQMTNTGLQTGPDGKIYFIYTNTTTGDDRIVGAINSPNLAGAACNVNATALNLGVTISGSARFSKPALFNTNPTITVSITGNTSVCPGQSTTLTASGATTYQWSGGGVNSTNDSIIVSPSTATQYFVTGTNSCGSAKDSVIVTINPAPTTTITGNKAICSGQSTTLTASGATSYQWSGGSTATTAAITVSPNTTTNYTVTPSNGSCTGTAIIDTVTVTPTPVASITSTSNTVCTGQSATLTGSGGTAYQWSGGSTATTSVITVSPTVATTYTLQAINGTCTNTTSITIQTSTFPVITITGNQTICAEQSTTLTASGATTYQWSGGSTATSASITVSPAATTTYTVTGTNTCGTSSASTSVTVNPNPVISIINPDAGSIQNGTSVQLEAVGGTSYVWSNGNNLSCYNCYNPIVSPTVTTTYIVSGTNAFGCIDTASVTITLLPGDDELYIPNCITNDGDGLNDIFYAYGINIKTLTMDIFDRWGELIFESNNISKGWDGTYKNDKVEIGVYVYLIKCEWNDGKNAKRRGIVTVVR